MSGEPLRNKFWEEETPERRAIKAMLLIREANTLLDSRAVRAAVRQNDGLKGALGLEAQILRDILKAIHRGGTAPEEE